MKFTAIISLCLLSVTLLPAADSTAQEFRVLATKKTSTMLEEMNEAAQASYSFKSVMGGESAFGGREVVVVMGREAGREAKQTKRYTLLATDKTSTMQKEMQAAGDEGFDYRGQTVFSSTFGGNEVAVILELDLDVPLRRYECRLLATSKTSTMDKELREAGAAGFDLLGLTVGQTAIGGNEIVCILRKLVD
jgi:hypothetical protein